MTTVRAVDGRIVIDWPTPRPETVLISSDLLDLIVDRLNDSSRLVDGLTDLDWPA